MDWWKFQDMANLSGKKSYTLVCMGLYHQESQTLHGEHLVGFGRFSTFGLMYNVCIVPHDGQQLYKYGHLVAEVAEVMMTLGNPLVNSVYTTHPVVMAIDESRFAHLDPSFVSPNFFCNTMLLSIHWATNIPKLSTHPTKMLKSVLDWFTFLSSFGGHQLQKQAVPKDPIPSLCSFAIMCDNIK
eukprot:955471-Ditylum_brightwellii.AAC.1